MGGSGRAGMPAPQPRWLAGGFEQLSPGVIWFQPGAALQVFSGRAKIQKRLGSRDLRLHFLICKMKVIGGLCLTHSGTLLRDPVTPGVDGD